MNIRVASTADIEPLATLSEELGYPSDLDDVRRRLSIIAAAEGHGVFVVEATSGSVVGWIHVFGAYRVESEPFAELGGLVVAETYRRSGLGTLLCEKARRWASDNGFDSLRVRTRVERKDAHAFYQRMGFQPTKAQQVFSIQLENS